MMWLITLFTEGFLIKKDLDARDLIKAEKERARQLGLPEPVFEKPVPWSIICPLFGLGLFLFCILIVFLLVGY